TSLQGSDYVGKIDAGEADSADLSIITTKETTEVIIEVSYRNDEGNTWHTEKLTLPLTAPPSEFSADLLVNKIELGSEGGYTAIRGMVHNAGISPAEGLSITTEGIGKCGEYPTYFIGELEANASAPFTVTFADFAENITLIMNYKDFSGNIYTKKEKLALDTIMTGFDDAENETIEPVVKPEPINWILVAILCAVTGAVIVGGSLLIWKKYHPADSAGRKP
ncbi:MAG: hypothetical protein Q4Q04_06790, partial [Methanocorpusculum sp.]|nr:hypothetical protein [Methanocorpusculum sp.]